jgi:hypothetical protein
LTFFFKAGRWSPSVTRFLADFARNADSALTVDRDLLQPNGAEVPVLAPAYCFK